MIILFNTILSLSTGWDLIQRHQPGGHCDRVRSKGQCHMEYVGVLLSAKNICVSGCTWLGGGHFQTDLPSIYLTASGVMLSPFNELPLSHRGYKHVTKQNHKQSPTPPARCCCL